MNDLIDRQAAIDAINSVLVEDESCKVWFKLAVKNLPSAQPEKRMETHACDLIDRQAAIEALAKFVPYAICDESTESYTNGLTDAYYLILQLPSVQPDLSEYSDKLWKSAYERGKAEAEADEDDWTLCSKRLPEDTRPVNITWVNREPESYYADIKDVPFTATGHYCKGKWYWYSVTCQDYLDEYGECEVDAVDNMIEVIAWKPLPEPYRGGEE